jgi:hypothetical protein
MLLLILEGESVREQPQILVFSKLISVLISACGKIHQSGSIGQIYTKSIPVSSLLRI